MSDINYLNILKKAWGITWHNKYLWWFGFFITLSGSSSFFNYSTSPENNAGRFEHQISDFILNNPRIFFIGLIAFSILFIIIFAFSILSRGALIKSIEKISNPPAGGETPGFKAGLREGKKYFWKIFMLSFLVVLSLVSVSIVLSMPVIFLFVAKSFVLGTLLAIAAVVILVPLFILAYFLRAFGFIYIVSGNLSLTDSIENAYALFRKNLVASFLLALIFIPISILAGFIFLLAVLFTAVIFFVIGLILFLLFSQIGAIIAIILALIIAALLFLLLRSIYETFAQSVWVFFFQEIAAPKVTEAVSAFASESASTPATNPDPVIFLDK